MAARLFALSASLALLSLLIPSAYGTPASFRVAGGNNIFFSVDIKYDGDITAVSLLQTDSPYASAKGWLPLKHSYGTTWNLDKVDPTLPPFSIKITDSKNNKFVAKDVIPGNWKIGAVYTANLAKA